MSGRITTGRERYTVGRPRFGVLFNEGLFATRGVASSISDRSERRGAEEGLDASFFGCAGHTGGNVTFLKSVYSRYWRSCRRVFATVWSVRPVRLNGRFFCAAVGMGAGGVGVGVVGTAGTSGGFAARLAEETTRWGVNVTEELRECALDWLRLEVLLEVLLELLLE